MGRGRRGPGIAREARRTSRPPPRGTFVEVNDPASRLMPGSAQAERDEILRDSLDRTVAWKGGPDPGRPAGQPTRLRMAMSDADLFLFRHRP